MDTSLLLPFHDSCLEGKLVSGEQVGPALQAIEALQRDRIRPLSFGGCETAAVEGSEIMFYRVESSASTGRGLMVQSARVHTSHYVGCYSLAANPALGQPATTLSIVPRFGQERGVFNRLLAHAYGIHLPTRAAAAGTTQTVGSRDVLLTLLWKAALERAMTRCQIPRQYERREANLRYFRGRLKMAEHIRLNVADASRFYCSYRQLTMDTTINRAVRYAYRLLKPEPFARVLAGLAEYDAKLAAFGVKDDEVSTDDFEAIRYTRLNAAYRPVIQLCRAVIQRQRAENAHAGAPNSFSFFIDLAELWEAYLLAVLRRHLKGYEVHSPNQTGGEHLVESGRSIRPDLIITRDGVAVAVVDAKYKYYGHLGSSAGVPRAVSRDDLYQMATYMYHHAPEDGPFLGLFVSPVPGEEQGHVHHLSKRARHQLGVLNLDLSRWDDDPARSFDPRELAESETQFATTVQSLLDLNLHSNAQHPSYPNRT